MYIIKSITSKDKEKVLWEPGYWGNLIALYQAAGFLHPPLFLVYVCLLLRKVSLALDLLMV
ncbi:MAG: hypothetical protein C0399_01580 [Syntrophus sp. (in: bacteria)]|nr:hypothetical protein [Syntrophus sp. (in: bacteria)]